MSQIPKISPSKIKDFEVCPAKLEFKYVFKIPQAEHDYFEIGKQVEACLWEKINSAGKRFVDLPNYKPEINKMADRIMSSVKFRELIEGKELQYQVKYETEDFIGYSDIETEDTIIDIKTSSKKWNIEDIKTNKPQVMGYLKHSGKPNFYFVVLNKTTLEVQVLKVNISDFSELENKIFEIKLAFEMGFFPKKNGYHCQRCDFNLICNKK